MQVKWPTESKFFWGDLSPTSSRLPCAEGAKGKAPAGMLKTSIRRDVRLQRRDALDRADAWHTSRPSRGKILVSKMHVIECP